MDWPLTLAQEFAEAGARADAGEVWAADHYPDPRCPALCVCDREWPCTRGEKAAEYRGHWSARRDYLDRKIGAIMATPTQVLPLAVRRDALAMVRAAASPNTATSGRLNDWLRRLPLFGAAEMAGVPVSVRPGRRRFRRRAGTPALAVPRQLRREVNDVQE